VGVFIETPCIFTTINFQVFTFSLIIFFDTESNTCIKTRTTYGLRNQRLDMSTVMPCV